MAYTSMLFELAPRDAGNRFSPDPCQVQQVQPACAANTEGQRRAL